MSLKENFTKYIEIINKELFSKEWFKELNTESIIEEENEKYENTWRYKRILSALDAQKIDYHPKAKIPKTLGCFHRLQQYQLGANILSDRLRRSHGVSDNWSLIFQLEIDNYKIENLKIKIQKQEDFSVHFVLELLRKYRVPKNKEAQDKIYNLFSTYFNISKDEIWLSVNGDDLSKNNPIYEIRLSAELSDVDVDKISKLAKEDAKVINSFLSKINHNWQFFKDIDQFFLEEEYVRMQKKINEIKVILDNMKQVILYGPPGTGKTYLAKQVAASLLDFEYEAGTNANHKQHDSFQKAQFSKQNTENEKGAWDIVQFHPSYNYEDFVRGITVSTDDKDNVTYKTEDKIFAELCKEAYQNKDKKYILIIDEINRADLASVLGELIYALEYRGEPVATPYQVDEEKTLTVPENLYIIGTMNTADRSIGHIDYAVRRRFAFRQILPDIEHVHDSAKTLFKDTVKLFGKEAFESIVGDEEANQIEEAGQINSSLSPDYHWEDVVPGHSYFMVNPLKNDGKPKTEDEIKDGLASKFVHQVWPLLEEYHKDGILTKSPVIKGCMDSDGKTIELDAVKDKLGNCTDNGSEQTTNE